MVQRASTAQCSAPFFAFLAALPPRPFRRATECNFIEKIFGVLVRANFPRGGCVGKETSQKVAFRFWKENIHSIHGAFTQSKSAMIQLT